MRMSGRCFCVVCRGWVGRCCVALLRLACRTTHGVLNRSDKGFDFKSRLTDDVEKKRLMEYFRHDEIAMFDLRFSISEDLGGKTCVEVHSVLQRS